MPLKEADNSKLMLMYSYTLGQWINDLVFSSQMKIFVIAFNSNIAERNKTINPIYSISTQWNNWEIYECMRKFCEEKIFQNLLDEIEENFVLSFQF